VASGHTYYYRVRAENAAAYSAVPEARSAPRPMPESAAARAAAASDPENGAAYADVNGALRGQETDASDAGARSAMVSDPENVASHTEGS